MTHKDEIVDHYLAGETDFKQFSDRTRLETLRRSLGIEFDHQQTQELSKLSTEQYFDFVLQLILSGIEKLESSELEIDREQAKQAKNELESMGLLAVGLNQLDSNP